MTGRIRDEDIALVRERADIEEVVRQHVTLRSAGSGSLKGLCPFHDEKSPSFHVTPSRGYYHCFGCGAGGDVIRFVQEIEGLSFAETVERLAARYDVQLRYTEGGTAPARDPHQRSRLIEAHRHAAAFYSAQLLGPGDAMTGRRFLAERGFDKAVAEKYGIGFSPRGNDTLLKHLRARGLRDEELVAAGLVATGGRGTYDRFRGRLMWPIKDLSGDVIGFGARRLFDDDRIEAKYLNTPESPLYKKSNVLYGVDRARREIARASRAVVVEGYTDVMACHESGVGTAVATCGTAFGEEHARLLRRLLLDHDEFRGEVIFTFDGDAAGQKAAMRAFQGDQQFVAQTYVAVQPDGLDPCELRLAKGDAAVRELVAQRRPLYLFVLDNIVKAYDLDRADQRVNAMRAAARLVASVRDRSKVDAFARELAGLVGMEVDEVRREVRRAAGRGDKRPSSSPRDQATLIERPDAPDIREPRFADELEALKAVVQAPQLAAPAADVDVDDFTHPVLASIWTALTAEPLPTESDPAWVHVVASRLPDDESRQTLTRLVVEPLRGSGVPDARLVDALLARLQELTTLRRVTTLKSRLQRTNPVEQPGDYNKMFGELVALEQHRRALRERAIGSGVL